MIGLIIIHESVRAMPHRWTHFLHMSSWQMPTSLPLLQLTPCFSASPVQHPSLWSGRLMGDLLYLMPMLSIPLSLVSSVPENLPRMVDSHALAAVACSIHFLNLGNMRVVWKATSPMCWFFRCAAPAAWTQLWCALIWRGLLEGTKFVVDGIINSKDCR